MDAYDDWFEFEFAKIRKDFPNASERISAFPNKIRHQSARPFRFRGVHFARAIFTKTTFDMHVPSINFS